MTSTSDFCKQIFEQKYAAPGESIEDCCKRVATALAQTPEERKEFLSILVNRRCIPGGRIMANAGRKDKKGASLINCTVSDTIDDSISGILRAVKESGETLHTGAGIGYCFSSLRPAGSYVSGIGAYTSGPISFMRIFDTMCSTISSAGGRRGAQMGTMHVWHPSILEFIEAKRIPSQLTNFNLSVLITDDFMEAVEKDQEWQLIFPHYEHHPVIDVDEQVIKPKSFWPFHTTNITKASKNCLVFKLYQTIRARDLWDKIMRSTYEFSEPGVLFIDRINQENPLNFAETIVATNPCGEQPLPPYGACLLGSINLTKYWHPEDRDFFDYVKLRRDTKVFTKLLNRVIPQSNLPLVGQRNKILSTKRIGIGIMGLGSLLNLMGIRYGSEKACEITSEIMRVIALSAAEQSVELNSPAPILDDENGNKYLEHDYCKLIGLTKLPANSHRTTIAPTGTTSLAFGNNCSSGIEPTFAHSYVRNVIIPGRRTKKQVRINSYEWEITENYECDTSKFVCSGDISPKEHINMQAAAQKWVDSSISKTINVPESCSYDDFKDIYWYAYSKGLKGCTTYRFNPKSRAGVLLTDSDLASTEYEFVFEDNRVETAKSDEIVMYFGEETTAANLYDYMSQTHA